MRRLRHALIVAAAAAVVLVVVARAESLTQPRAESIAQARRLAASDAALDHRRRPSSQRPVLFARVTKPFGASVRVAAVVRGGDHVQHALRRRLAGAERSSAAGSRSGPRPGPAGSAAAGWSSAARRRPVDCSEARVHLPDGLRLDVRADRLPEPPQPTRRRRADPGLRRQRTRYAVLDGPFDPGSGDDWFRVTSPSTGSGWALAEHLTCRPIADRQRRRPPPVGL